MSYLVRFCCTALLAFTSHAACARDRERKASTDTAARVFWNFARCAVERRTEASRELLDRYTHDKAGRQAAQTFAQIHGYCLAPGDELRMKEGLFIGALAGAYFIKKYKDVGLPDYSALPPLVDGTALQRETNLDKMRHDILLSFGDCVFRSRPEASRSLLSTRPASDQEAWAFDQIKPVLGDCLPAQEGAQFTFSRPSLRSIIGEAAYRLDRKLPATAAAAREVLN